MSGKLYPDYLSFIGFVSAVVTQYFVSCDVGLKPNKTKYKIVFLMALFFQEFLLGRNVGTHKMVWDTPKKTVKFTSNMI